MTDQPAAPFDVAKARKSAQSSLHVVEYPGCLAELLLAACDRIDYLDFHWRKSTDREAIASIRAEAAEARVKTLTDNAAIAEEALADMTQSNAAAVERAEKAEAANAALVEAARACRRYCLGTDCSTRNMVNRLDALLASPSPGAKLLEELEQTRTKVEKLCCELGNVMMERDRLAKDALVALAGSHIGTPAEGYVKSPWCLAADIERLRDDRDRLAARITTLYDAISHGDDDHKAWLKAKLDEHFRACDEETKP